MEEWLSKVPERLREIAAEKVAKGVLDAGESLSIVEKRIVVRRRVAALSDVWIIDHFLTFDRIDESSLECVRGRLEAMGGAPDIVETAWRLARPLPRRSSTEIQRFYVEDEVGSAFPRGRGDVRSLVAAAADEYFTLCWPATDLEIGATPEREAVVVPSAATTTTRPRPDGGWRRRDETIPPRRLPGLRAPVRIFTDLDWVKTHVTDTRFAFVEEGAECLFIASGGFETDKVRSWYDYEAALVRKDHLATTLKRAGLTDVAPETYDLDIEMVPEGGTWILKPASLARGLGVVVAKSRACVLAHAAAKGYVAQRYVERPVLFENRKFDVRIVALLRSAEPLELYAHDVVFARAANKPHDLGALDDPQVYLTAMHLVGGGVTPNHPRVDDVAAYIGVANWHSAIERARAIIADVFSAAAHLFPGFAQSSPRSRAMYGCDFIFEKEDRDDGIVIKPRLLEITFNPAHLAVSDAMPDKYPDFANDCFRCLFLGELSNRFCTSRCDSGSSFDFETNTVSMRASLRSSGSVVAKVNDYERSPSTLSQLRARKYEAPLYSI
ncbi:hypothetical protein CTAYLR_007654 [Chrysophaeum taylorii]|uniref:Uncharacterized protein n=1 Tax=Chrysophaeum taylorii TaxID=2483200 RepID=A0AAD7XHD6_9STRA|nr:hypothetical protein CTAYLR_007654 [Chrysophaeum taylorii]